MRRYAPAPSARRPAPSRPVQSGSRPTATIGERLTLTLPGEAAPIAPTHWSFGQLTGLVGAPAAYLRQLPAPLAAINLQYGLTTHRQEQIKTLTTEADRVELRAVTGPDYGRIFDHELVEAVMRIAGNGTGDTRWKVPGVLDWRSGRHDPFAAVTKATTTLYASDRDVFLFLVDDTHPIEAGRLPDGSPDLYFRGFYCWNSEVGSKTLGIASFYLRAVCQNRNLWGVEDFQEIAIRHSKYAASRFAHEAAPALARFANASPAPFMNGIKAARAQIVARDDEERTSFLRGRGFSKPETEKIIATVLREEGHAPESVFDFVQGITAVARTSRIRMRGSSSSSAQRSSWTERRDLKPGPAVLPPGLSVTRRIVGWSGWRKNSARRTAGPARCHDLPMSVMAPTETYSSHPAQRCPALPDPRLSPPSQVDPAAGPTHTGRRSCP